MNDIESGVSTQFGRILNELEAKTGRRDWEICRSWNGIMLDTEMSDGTFVRILAEIKLTSTLAFDINLAAVRNRYDPVPRLSCANIVANKHVGIIVGLHDMNALIADIKLIDRLKTLPYDDVVSDAIDVCAYKNRVNLSSRDIFSDPFKFANMSIEDKLDLKSSLLIHLVSHLAKKLIV